MPQTELLNSGSTSQDQQSECRYANSAPETPLVHSQQTSTGDPNGRGHANQGTGPGYPAVSVG